MVSHEYEAKVVRVVDADTLDLEVDLGFTVKVKTRARLDEVNAPEIYGVKHESEEYAKGKAAMEWVDSWLRGELDPDADPQTTNSYLPVVIASRDGKKLGVGKYGRWLVRVFRSVKTENGHRVVELGNAMIDAGHAERTLYS